MRTCDNTPFSCCPISILKEEPICSWKEYLVEQQRPFDFSDIPIVDTHAHGPMMGKDTASYLRSTDFWYNYFADELMPRGSTDETLRASIKSAVIRQAETRPN